ncbi:DNA-3-methyladenine glycosylase family protein [Pseudothioclava nitratireducens]|uniref:DNA-3-methyladenine glycosylase family protein n=1 Tax=Pseudothioclava nitratireducens TaxID=1928646 RepID=UPI0023DAA562|nr:DNA-3-methyladenine glycosylase 2 family protein [Defluviimonas nitratireducens]MDF1619339.1 DNA-3-methyladenine glycosylase 2 family protein [Defluviimonas nitratireducens]
MVGRIIACEADIAEGADWLARAEPRFAEALVCTGPWPLRRREDGFAALRDAIIGQQVSVASANAIRGRVLAAGFAGPEPIAAAPEEALRACGLSRQKIRYLQALSVSGVDFEGLRALPDEEVIAQLLPIPGIGRWTVEMYLIFALGRADVFAVDDLALAEGARMLFDLPERPKRKEFNALSASWSPWRAVAARGLWAYYAYRKNREGVAP